MSVTKTIVLSFVILLLGKFSTIQAQTKSAMGSEYRTALGIKFYPGSFSIKHFTSKGGAALEGLVYFWDSGARFTGLYEIHGAIAGAPGLKWYIGPGAHIGFWNDAWMRNNPNRNGGVTFGVDGVLGLDYKLKGIPLNFSLDWQPSFNITGYTYFEPGWGGIGVRYTIK